MVLKLYGVPVSQPVRTVMWACAYKGLKFDFVFAMPGAKKKGGTQTPEFLAMNPTGTVPAIDDDGFILAESNAILAYLAEKHRWTDIYPTDLQQRAKINEYLHWHHKNTRSLTVKLFAPIVRPETVSSPGNKQQDEKMVRAIMKYIDTRLSKSKFIVGDSLTIADFAAYTEFGQCDSHLLNIWDFSPYSNIQRWLREMERVPGYDVVHKDVKKFIPVFNKIRAKYESKL